ncbi:MAG: glycosyltransferase family 1 protein, partial [Deltaproteobacteria bacterium]
MLHPRLGRGGSEAGAMWALEALQDDHALTLLTTGDVDWDGLNAFCGTAVRGAEVAVSRPALPPGPLR